MINVTGSEYLLSEKNTQLEYKTFLKVKKNRMSASKIYKSRTTNVKIEIVITVLPSSYVYI